MAELNIKERNIGDITVLDMDGKITIGEGSMTLRNVIGGLLEQGRDKIVLNLSGVSYIDSSGIQELTYTFVRIHQANGGMRICHFTQKLQDLLAITKLISVFPVSESVEHAISELTAIELYIICPVYGCHNSILFSDLNNRWFVSCFSCGSSIHFQSRLSSDEDKQTLINFLQFPTYDKEYIRVYMETPFRISIISRLDLFASEVLEKAWQSLPFPRRVLFDISYVKEITDTGKQTLLNLCTHKESDSLGVILDKREGEKIVFLPSTPVSYEEKDAVVKLGCIPDKFEWLLNIFFCDKPHITRKS